MMKKRILFILLAVVLAISVGLIGCGGEQEEEEEEPECPETIVVGMVRDLDQDLAFFECNAGGPVWRYYINKVNTGGGIPLSDYGTDCSPLIEVVLEDWDITDFMTITTVTQGLIDGGADFIFGGPGTDTIAPQAGVCNAPANLGKVLHMSLEGGASVMIWDRDEYLDIWPYTFVSLSFANWYQIALLQEMLEEAVGDTPKAYITCIGELGQEHGIEYKTETITQFGTENVYMQGEGFHSYNVDETEANTIIQNAAAALVSTPYDIFCAWTYPWNVATLIGACIANNFTPPAMVFGPGANFNSYGMVYFGPMMENILCFAIANRDTVPNVGNPTMSMDDMYDALVDQIDYDYTHDELPGHVPANWCDLTPPITDAEQQLDVWGMPCYVAALEIWEQAIINAGDIDAAAVRAEICAYTQSAACDTVLGDGWFRIFGPSDDGTGGGVLDYKCHTGEIGQWQEGQIEIVGPSTVPNTELPNYDVTDDFVFDVPWGYE